MSGFTLQSLVGTQNPYQQKLEQNKHLVNRWGNTGLLEGLEAEQDRIEMSILLENEARKLWETTATGGSDAEAWSGVALPLVRRIFAEIAAKEFVSVQPMTMPSGLIFYLDFKYSRGTTQPGFTAGQSVFGGSNNELTGASPEFFGRTDVAQNGFYGPARFGYTINDLTGSYTSASAASLTTYKVEALSDWYALGFDETLSGSLAAGELFKVSIFAKAGADTEGVRAFKISGSPIVSYFPLHTSYAKVSGNDLTVFIVSASSAGDFAGDTLTLTYHKQPTKDARGDFEDQSYLFNYQQLDIPEIDLQIKQEPIVAKTRKLKAVWTPELVQDLNAYHSVDAEAELTSILSEYISMEIDLEILDMLVQNTLTEDYWSAQIGMEFDSLTNRFVAPTSNTGQFYTKKTWYETLGIKMQKVSNLIHQKTLRGGANFAAVSPKVATILESIPGFNVDTNGDKMQFAAGVSKVGSIDSRWQVYKIPYLTDHIILMGFKGNSFLETGAVYSPYVPLEMTPIVYEPNNMTPRKGVMTRYAKKMVRPEFFGRILVHGLNLV